MEVFQKMSDEPLVVCPECGEEKLRRLFGVPGIKFIGPGFYVNDYPKDKGGP
jgi:putative FmdB family regulatory protein